MKQRASWSQAQETNVLAMKSMADRAKADWTAFDALTDDEIRAAATQDPDAAPVGAEFWKGARVVMPDKENKQSVTIRLDGDVLRFFRRERGYQTRINAILRSYMKVHRD